MTRAAVLWQRGEGARFDFSIEASKVVGQYEAGATKRLAEEIHRSEDSVQRFAKTGRMWFAVLQRWPSEAEILRDTLQHGYWHCTTRLWKEDEPDTLELVLSCLEQARDEGWSVEAYRNQLPREEVPQAFGTWLDKIRDWKEAVSRLFDAMGSSKEKQAAARKVFESLKQAEDTIKELERAS